MKIEKTICNFLKGLGYFFGITSGLLAMIVTGSVEHSGMPFKYAVALSLLAIVNLCLAFRIYVVRAQFIKRHFKKKIKVTDTNK